MECKAQAEWKFTNPEQPQSHQHGGEACTPFCFCSCCATSIIQIPIAKFQAQKTNGPLEKFPFLSAFYQSNVFSNIWQPPRAL